MIKLSSSDIDKVYRAMRSLFRYTEFQNKNYPEVLVEQEEKILAEAFKNLNAQEIFYVLSKWPEFLKEQSVEQELENNKLFTLIQKEFDSLN